MASPSEWDRSDPDFSVYRPSSATGRDASNQHFLVVPTPAGTFVAIWTQASAEADPDQRVVAARSTDRGETWSGPVRIDGADPDDAPGEGMASWGFPVVAPGVRPDGGHRIYAFYNKNVGVDDARAADTGVLRCRYSDDDGRTWSEETHDHAVEPCAISDPDPDVPETWIVYQTPTVTPEGAVLAGFTHWASDAFDPDRGMFDRHSEVRFLRFEDILEASDPGDLTVTTWPDAAHGLQVPHPERPGASVVQEPSVATLPDDRLVCVTRTLTGEVHFALSGDDGRTWDTPRPLCYEPEGERRPLENPISPCPLYELDDGRYLLVFYDNDGTGHGGTGPKDTRRNRTPAWYTVGEPVDHPTHPLRFDEPRVLVDNDRVPHGPVDRTEIATYPSFFEHDDRAYFWYPDRKHFLLGRDLSDELALAGPG